MMHGHPSKPSARVRLMCFLRGAPKWFKYIILGCLAAVAILTVLGFAGYILKGAFDPTKIFPLLLGLGI